MMLVNISQQLNVVQMKLSLCHTWLKCHYMQQHLGEEFVGIIATAEFGLFVTLKDLYVDGMIHVSQLGDDYFVYDQASQSLLVRIVVKL
jgi:ribonuclease R